VGGACGTDGRGEKRVQGFSGKARRKKDYLKDQGVNGIKMDLRETGWGGVCVKWIHLAEDREHWGAVVNAMMNLRFLAPRSC
jgi:hypothetical protein